MGCNAKCCYLKKLTCRDFAADALSVWGPLPSYDPILRPPVHTVYVNTVHTYSHREGGEGGELTREKVRGAIVHNAGRKYQHDWLYLQSINFIKHQHRYYCYLVHGPRQKMKNILALRMSSSLIVEHKIIKYNFFTYVLQSRRHANFGPQDSWQEQGGENQENGRIDHLNKYNKKKDRDRTKDDVCKE